MNKPHIVACFPKSFFEKKKLFFQVSYTDLMPDGKTSKNTFLKTYDMLDNSFDNALNRMKKELKLKSGATVLDLSTDSYGHVFWKPKNKNKLLTLYWEKN